MKVVEEFVTYDAASSSTTALNITVGNNAPTIPVVNSISATNPTDDTTTSITFNFTATDTDGAANLNPATAQGYLRIHSLDSSDNPTQVKVQIQSFSFDSNRDDSKEEKYLKYKLELVEVKNE